MKPSNSARWSSGASGREALRYEPFEPRQPEAGELLIEVHAAALNFSDILMIDGKYQVKPPRPFTPGQEVAGKVVTAGPATRRRPGARIASKVEWGGFATHAIVRDDMVLTVAQGCSFTHAAALPVSYTTAYVALTECTTVLPGETVLVHAAAGAVGLAAVQIAASIGAKVIATAGNRQKRLLAENHGATHSLDYSDPNWVKACRDLTNDRGVDVIVDPVGGDTTLESLHVLAPGARLLIVGFASGTIPKIPAHRLLLKRASVLGVYWNHDADAEMLDRISQRLSKDLATGAIAPVIDLRHGLESLPQALVDLSDRRTFGKVVLRIADEGDSDG